MIKILTENTTAINKIAADISKIPQEMKALRQWVCFSLGWNDKRKKYDKFPTNPVTGGMAMSNNPNTWVDFHTALQCFNSSSFNGIGFMFTKESGIYGVDIDGCFNNGVMSPEAQAVIGQMQSYTEWSPSATGVHIIARGTLPPGGRRKGNFEMYDSGRFFTVTGWHVQGTPIEIYERTNEVAIIHAKYIAKPQLEMPRIQKQLSKSSINISDAELIDKILSSKQCFDFQLLWDGDTSKYNNDASGADLALCSLFAFWTGRDAVRMDALFRQSGLYRPKWDERHFSDGTTYGAHTINKAIKDCCNVYDATFKAIDQEEWRKKLKYNEDGKILKTPANCLLILRNDSKLKGKFSYDMTVSAAFKTKGLPWSQKDNEYSMANKKMMSDGDFKALYNYFHDHYGISNTGVIDNSFAEFCMSIQNNPLLDYLNSLQWDGVQRVDTLLVDYYNAEDTLYTREVTRKKLTALIRRAYQPGIKFDTCLILKGAQGLGKSTLFNILGGQWYTDGIEITNDAARTYESHMGKWLCELGELTSLRKTEAERLKSFFVAQYDRYRPPYGKNVMDIPRMCIVVGTTNSEQFLKDITGNRRYWPVRVFAGGKKNIFIDLAKERDQILAEAKVIHESGEPIFLTREIEKMAALMQQEFVVRDAWADRILNYLEIVLTPDWKMKADWERKNYIDENQDKTCGSVKRDRVSTEIIWTECLHGRIEQLSPQTAGRIRDIMNQAPGWIKTKGQIRIPGYGKGMGWERENV